MAAMKTFDLSEQLICVNGVNKKPPLPSRPLSGTFHNRGSGKLFPSTKQNRLFNETQTQNQPDSSVNELALVLHKDAKIEQDSSQPNTPKSLPRYCKRTQSAKAKTVRKDESQKTSRVRPQSAGTYFKKKPGVGTSLSNNSNSPAVIDLATEVIPSLFEIERDKLLALPEPTDNSIHNEVTPMNFSRPSSAKSDLSVDSACVCRKGNHGKSPQNNIKPSVYGLNNHRQFYGNDSNTKTDQSNLEHFPYKTSEDQSVTNNSQMCSNQSSVDIPTSLEPLLPWLQRDISTDILGVNTNDCLVFLSPTDWDSLPVVPDLELTEDDDLPYVKDITTPKPWNPKKYKHYFSKPVEDWVCKHGSQLDNDDTEINESTVYRRKSKKRATFRLPRMRSAEVIKKEISDLENLLKGIGSKDSDCGMVQYQSEIACFRSLLSDTLDMVPERLKSAPLKSPKDRFGLKQVFKDHDVIIQNIQERVTECRMELADLELEAGIDTARQYFRKRSNSVL